MFIIYIYLQWLLSLSYFKKVSSYNRKDLY